MSKDLSVHRGSPIHRCAQGILICLFAPAISLGQGTTDNSPNVPYRIKVTTNEVSIIFRASNAFGFPIDDLKASEIDVFDNGNGPASIVALQKLQERPLRLGFILDTSGSVSMRIARNREVAVKVAEKLLQKQTDFGLAIGFRRSRNVVQMWSHNMKTVTAGIRSINRATGGPLDGTSLFDTLFSTCLYEFGNLEDDNERVIFLFSDGVDTEGHTTLEKAVSECQRVHTAVYAFNTQSAHPATSSGSANLIKLTEETGGTVIPIDVPDAELNLELDELENNIRDEYQLFYRPKSLTPDGSFHRIVLVGPSRAAQIVSQSGYYAPARYHR